MPSLQTLAVSYNNITGEFPSDIVLLEKLMILDASNNRISGTFPPIDSLINLELLIVSENLLSRFEHDLRNVALAELRLSNNLLTGTLPYINSTNMKMLYV